MAKEWWEEAPVVEDNANWWADAPLADEPPKKRTWGEAITDTGKKIASGVSAVGEEFGRLRDEVFTGVDNTKASAVTVNTAAQAAQLQKTNDRLAELMSYGEGDTPEAQGLRKTADFYSKRMPRMVGDMTEAQADAQRGAAMTTRPAVAAMGAAKTFGEAWDIFKANPYDVIAGVTATSLPGTVPALIVGAAMGPAAGAAAMGGSSGITEAGSSIADFARESGVDTTDRKAVESFFANRENLAAAMSYAGKRAGIIGALDAASGGIAGKTLAPAFKSGIARQAVNVPTQMAVQAGAGAGGEAGAQLATKGRIDQPGQVLMEAAGELGGAPSEVAAFSKDARDAILNRGPAKPDPVQSVMATSSVDEAIAAAAESVEPIAEPAPSTAVQDAGQAWRDMGILASGATSSIAARQAGQGWQDIAPEQTGSLDAQRAEIERAGAQASAERDARLADVGQQWQDLGITDPQDDLQAQRAGMRGEPTAMQLAMQRAQEKADVSATPDLQRPAAASGGAGSIDAPESLGNGVDAGERPGADPAGSGNSGLAEPGVRTAVDAAGPLNFSFTKNASGTVLVDGDPAAIRAAFPDAQGMVKYTDGQPSGVLFSTRSSPSVLAQLETPRVQNPAQRTNPETTQAAPAQAPAAARPDASGQSAARAEAGAGALAADGVKDAGAESNRQFVAEMQAEREKDAGYKVPEDVGNALRNLGARSDSKTKETGWSLPTKVGSLGDVFIKFDPATNEATVTAQHMGKTYDETRANGPAAIAAAIERARDGIDNGVMEMARRVAASRVGSEKPTPKSNGAKPTDPRLIPVSKRGTPDQQKAATEAGSAQSLKLETIAERLGFSVNKSKTGWHASGTMLSIPTEDADLSSAVSADHVFAHELGHGVMNKRGVSLKGFPVSALKEKIPNWTELVAASKEFRPGVHDHESEKARAHAKKPNEIIADAIASVLIGEKPLALLRPLMGYLGINKVDLGLQTVDEANAESRAAKSVEQNQPAAPVQPASPATETVADAGPLGRNNVPLSEGGKPYKTKLSADTARKNQPAMRVKRVEGGYVLVEKTPAQLAAQEKAAKRLSQPRTSPKGEPIPAHSMIAAAGGLSKEVMADMGMGDNPKVGNRRLFAAAGGLTIEQATEKLVEDGYLQEGASHSQAMDLIKRSLTNPQYTPEGTERMAEKELQEREAAFNAEQEAVAELEAADDNVFDINDDDIPWDAPVSNTSTEDAMRALGFTDQEISDAIANEPGRQGQDSQGGGRPDEGAAAQAPADMGSRESAPREDQGDGATDTQGIRGDLGSVQGVQKELEAGQAEIDEAKRLKYKLPYLEDRLRENLDPTDGFDMHILANELPPNRAYNKMMTDHNGDFSGVEFKNKDGRHAFVLPDASQPGKWRISYFDKNGFSRHESEPTREKAQQSLAREGYTIEDKGALDRLAATKEWALGTDFAGLIFQLNSGAITHTQFIEKQNKLNADYEASKEEGLTSPTREGVLAQQDRAEAAAKEQARADKEATDKAKADADVGEFTLTGSDRAADVGAAGGQTDIFGAAAEPEAQPTPDPKPAAEMSVQELLRAAADKMDGVKTEAKAPIGDFGQKIGGAKKDTWTGFKDDLGAVSDDEIAGRKLSEIWPNPDYQKMIDDGMDAKSVAVIRALRDEIPAKPRSPYKVKRWAEQVKTMRDLAANIMNGKDTGAAIVAQMDRGSSQMRGIAGRVDLYMAVGHDKSLEGIRLSKHHYSLYRGRENVTLWVAERDAGATAFSNWPQELATGDTKEQAIEAFREKYDSLDATAAVKKAEFVIFTKGGGDKGFYIGKKIGRNIADMGGPFDSLKDARAYREKNLPELEAKLAKYKEIPKERRDTNEPRVGEDMRNGQDVTPEMFAEAFGFKGVEFGNYVEQKRRQKDLNDSFDALMDMAAIMGVPAKAISLNGELGLAFGARGSGGVNPAAAHYESDKIVINLTKREGAGSLGHEWWHALDNYFSRMRGNRTSAFMTTATDVNLSARGSNYVAYPGVRKEMIDAFGEVVRSIKNTAIKARSSKIDAKRTKEYWTTGEEMAARAFESYLISKLHDQNASNDYLANVVDQKTWDAMAALGMENEDSYPYPTAGEMPVIRAGFDKFFQTLETKETDKGVAMFSRASDEDSPGLEAFAKADELFALPLSKAKDLEQIARDNGEEVTVRTTDLVGEKLHTLIFSDGTEIRVSDRKANPYGQDQQVYAFDLVDGTAVPTQIGRPGENPEDVPPTDDVWVDVSRNTPANLGAKAYNIAMTYALNNDKIFVGDPAGLTDMALRRRTEQMLSHALKSGTARHLAPHPRQVAGDAKLGVPPLKWIYGDHVGNIERMIDVSLESLENGSPGAKDDTTYDQSTGEFRGKDGQVVPRFTTMGRSRERYADGLGKAQAGWRTLARAAYLRSFRGPDGRAEGSGILDRAGADAARLANNQTTGAPYSAKERVFYSEGQRPAVRNPSTVTRVQAAVAELIGSKQLPNRLGRVVATTAAEIKSTWEPLIDKSVNIGSEGDAGVAQAFYDPPTKTVFLIADHISQGNETAVAGHELMHKHGQDVLGKDGWDRMHSVIGTWENAEPGSQENAVYQYARSKVEAVGLELSNQELFPYAVEAAFKMGIKPSMAAKAGTVARWLESVRQNMKMVWAKITGKPETFKTQDLVDLAYGIAQRENPEYAMEDFKSAKQDQTDTPEFRKWFGDSKVVDADGKPLVVYHGTNADFTSFDLKKAGQTDKGWYGKGIYFTPNSNWTFAEDSADSRGGNPSVMPIYLRIENPMYAYAHAEQGSDLVASAKERGMDGVIVRFDPGHEKAGEVAEIIVFRPEQIKSATGNNGQFDGANPDIRFSRASSPHSWDAPEQSKFDDLVYKLQDKQIDTKRVVEEIRKTGKALADEKDVYLQEELFHGRAAARTEDFVNNELSPLITEMKMRGIDIATLDEYLHARHAQEANELIAERNPDIQDGGSGMTTKAARDYLAKLDPAERKRLEAVAAKVDAILGKTRQMYADYNLESQATVNGWGQMFKNYVPLMREDKDGGMGIGQGFSIKGKETKGRTGSTRKVVDILANIAMQRERAIVRGEKNRVATALVGLAELNPNEDFWAVGPPPTEKVYDPKSNTVVDRADPLFKSRENVVVAKVKEPSGEVVEKAVRFNEDNERAVRMAVALKNLDAAQLNGLLGVSAKISRYFAAINTQYNPIFGVVNLVRDVQGAILNLTTTPLKDKKAEIAGHTLAALKGVYLDARAAREGKPQTSAWAKLWEDFQNEGGQTGYRDMFANSNDRAKAIEYELNPTKWMDSPLGKVFTANGTLKVPLEVAQKKAEGLFGWLSDYNLAMENAVRLSAYKVGLEQGMSKQQAASLAKNLTVNFNRKGQVGQQAGAVYAFFNASMQGSARLGKTLFDMDGSDPKTIRLSPTGKKIVYGGILLGVVQSLTLAAAGFDDEEPPEFVRERSLIIPTGGKTYITIPMPLGLHVLPNMGRIPTEFVLGGFKQPVKSVVKLLGLTAGAFNPIGGGASLTQMLAPTAVDPLVALAENKDWTGKPIAKTSYNKATPGFALTKDTASAPSKVLAEAINTISGGTKYTAGVLSPTPDQIDYLWGQVTGGVGRELSKAQQSASAMVSGEDLPIHKIPLLGRFYGDADTQSAQSSKFYSTINRLNEHEAEIKGLRKDRKAAELAEYMRDNPDARMFETANKVELEVQKMRRMKRELIALDAPPERIKALEERITLTMTRFNERAAAFKKRESREAEAAQ